MDYKKYILSRGGEEFGISFVDIEEYLLTPNEYKKFMEFMNGQTCSIIAGIEVCYTGDFERFINGLHIID